MSDATLGSEVGYSPNSDKEEAPSDNGEGQESSNDSVKDNDQVKEAVMEVEEQEKGEAEKEEEEEEQEENREQYMNEDRMNNEDVTDIEGGKDLIETNSHDNDKDKNNEDYVEMNPSGWEKAYEIRIDILKQEIDETEKKHELWQDKIKSRKDDALKRWEMIKKKKQDRLKAQKRLHAVMDSVLNNDNEETMKEESGDI